MRLCIVMRNCLWYQCDIKMLSGFTIMFTDYIFVLIFFVALGVCGLSVCLALLIGHVVGT